MEEQTKQCTKCGETKSISDFSRDKYKRDGLTCWCRSCLIFHNQSKDFDYIGNPFSDTKICSKCGIEKLQIEFYRSRRIRGGLHSWCKQCLDNYRQDHKTEIKLRRRKHDLEHKEEVAAQLALWQKKNPYKVRAGSQRRRANKRKVKCDLTQNEWEELLKYYKYSCAYCGMPQKLLTRKLVQEHIIPLIRGGEYTALNIVPACVTCNLHKGSYLLEEVGMVLLKPNPFIKLSILDRIKRVIKWVYHPTTMNQS